MNAEIFAELRRSVAEERLAILATVVRGEGTGRQLLIRPGEPSIGDLGSPARNRQAESAAVDAARTFASSRLDLVDESEEAELFLEVHAPPEQLVIVGAVHVAIHLIEFARILGFRTLVVDPRTAFATPERFAEADRLIAAWPEEAFAGLDLNESTYVVTLSHDFKIDLPALELALASPARYVGALGSRRTHARRIEELAQRGLSAEQIARIKAPVGLDLGGRRAEEIALSIAAEIQAARHGR